MSEHHFMSLCHVVTCLSASQTAILHESDEGVATHITYNQLHQEVCRVANVLKHWGVKRGDTVAIYMPMIPELGECWWHHVA